ncbi:unnamed protein product [Rangifer tarandus platyrhynchus]|uniref:Uncharacterized protein n=2 Tax=Rangifer tarandus platyrhynchus TaxID=3082113 RepID=A0ACB0FAY2_RANTA|nr:unnamed protein product [Rangifer tarandus platyrhynchus]CAI9710081.1 unnamed protein product [Rangifer tarandus platyrhynchus]
MKDGAHSLTDDVAVHTHVSFCHLQLLHQPFKRCFSRPVSRCRKQPQRRIFSRRPPAGRLCSPACTGMRVRAPP